MENSEFKAICVGAGGIIGMFYLGALDYYYEKKLLDNVMYYSGTSIGAFVCGLLMIGYSPRDIIVYLCKNDFSKNFGRMSVQNLFSNYGLIDTTELKKYLEKIIIEKLTFIPTLKEMYDATRKIFYCTSYRVSYDGKDSDTKTYFSYRTHPSMLLSDAIMCSCSIPFLFSKTLVDNSVYIDGAVFDPVPVKALMKHFSDDEYNQILTVSFKNKNKREEENILSYISKVMNAILEREENVILAQMTEHVQIETDVLPYNFYIDNSKKINMFLEGQEFAKKKYVKKEKID